MPLLLCRDAHSMSGSWQVFGPTPPHSPFVPRRTHPARGQEAPLYPLDPSPLPLPPPLHRSKVLSGQVGSYHLELSVDAVVESLLTLFQVGCRVQG